MLHTLIADIRFVSIEGRPAHLEIRRGHPAVDASGAICGFHGVGEWEAVYTAHFDTAATYKEHIENHHD